MSRIRADQILNGAGTGAPNFSLGLQVGAATTIHTTGIDLGSGNIQSHNINSTGIITAASGSFSGNVSVGGTLTYEDVTSIDSVGVITAQSGIHVTGGDVGINTTSNNDGAHFQHYQSEVRHQSFQSTNGDLSIVTDNNSNPAVYIKGTGNADLVNVFDNTTEVFTIKDGGNVAIGTDNPSSVIFTVRGDNNTTFTNNPASMLIAGNDSATSGSSGAGIFFGGRYLDGQDTTTTFAAISGIKETTSDNEYGGALVFGTRAAGSGGGSFERMRIDSNGYMTKAPSGMVIRSGFYDPGTGTNATTATTSATFTTLNINGTGQVGHNIGKFSDDGLTYTKVSSNSHLNISVSIPFYLAVGGTGFGIRALLSTDNGSNYYTVTGLSNGPADKWGAAGYGGNTSGIVNYTWNTRMNSSRASAILAKTGTIRFYFEVAVWSSSDTLTIGDYPSYNKKSSIIVQEIAE